MVTLCQVQHTAQTPSPRSRDSDSEVTRRVDAGNAVSLTVGVGWLTRSVCFRRGPCHMQHTRLLHPAAECGKHLWAARHRVQMHTPLIGRSRALPNEIKELTTDLPWHAFRDLRSHVHLAIKAAYDESRQ